MVDTTFGAKIQHTNNGDKLVVASGGEIAVETGGAITGPGGASLNDEVLTFVIADGSAEATYWLVSPFAGSISKIYTVIDGAVSTADITVTAKIGSTGMTSGVITITQSGSAAGDVDVATPSAANVITAGAAMNFVVTGGGSGGAPKITVSVVITR